MSNTLEKEENVPRVTFGGYNLFEIENYPDKHCQTYRQSYDGYWGGDWLEAYYDRLDNRIVSVVCPLSYEMYEREESISDSTQEDELIQLSEPIFHKPEKSRVFWIGFNREMAVIMFEAERGPAEYYTSGRVDYIFDKNHDLWSIQIRNLTEEEFGILHADQIRAGSYLKPMDSGQ